MANYVLGHVVNVRFPNQENIKKSTVRPAIIVEDLEDEVEVVFMTCQTSQQKHYPDSFIVKKDSKEGKILKLTCDSLICPDRSFQVKKIRLFERTNGPCSEELLNKILEFL